MGLEEPLHAGLAEIAQGEAPIHRVSVAEHATSEVVRVDLRIGEYNIARTSCILPPPTLNVNDHQAPLAPMPCVVAKHLHHLIHEPLLCLISCVHEPRVVVPLDEPAVDISLAKHDADLAHPVTQREDIRLQKLHHVRTVLPVHGQGIIEGPRKLVGHQVGVDLFADGFCLADPQALGDVLEALRVVRLHCVEPAVCPQVVRESHAALAKRPGRELASAQLALLGDHLETAAHATSLQRELLHRGGVHVDPARIVIRWQVGIHDGILQAPCLQVRRVLRPPVANLGWVDVSDAQHDAGADDDVPDEVAAGGRVEVRGLEEPLDLVVADVRVARQPELGAVHRLRPLLPHGGRLHAALQHALHPLACLRVVLDAAVARVARVLDGG
mmetsp:Transcript_4853/g.14431  ORF Transcript_4853/g.14431 Transcript_4853/m.14431 type:complete len:385 (+) Transcript_4853:384-1538(+)